jgi:DNA mismatch repair protein MutS
VVRGEADKSYGIEVANLAGVPSEVTSRAKNILRDLEENDINYSNNISSNVDIKENKSENQIDIFKMKENEIIELIKNIDLINLTPLESMNLLNELIDKTKEI